MSTPLITDEQVALASIYGHRFDIGQFSAPEKKVLERRVKTGELLKVKAMWPELTWGTWLKTCYINTRDNSTLPEGTMV